MTQYLVTTFKDSSGL
ncbi:DUF1381 domain-containing protein, partial [Staphylococcus aureus]